MSESKTRADVFSALQELSRAIPEMRAGQLAAAVGELCIDLHGRGLWDAADEELIEAVWQFRRNYEAAVSPSRDDLWARCAQCQRLTACHRLAFGGLPAPPTWVQLGGQDDPCRLQSKRCVEVKLPEVTLLMNESWRSRITIEPGKRSAARAFAACA